MPALYNEVRHLILVLDSNGAGVTGLDAGDFTITLQYAHGLTLVTAPETVSVFEIGLGQYWVAYTPVTEPAVYVLTIRDLGGLAYYQFQDQVDAGVTGVTGPYLSTRANVKTAFGIDTSETAYDTAIDNLLAQVTAAVQGYCGQQFFAQSFVDYYDGQDYHEIVLRNRPATSITSVHVSTAMPRAYTSVELLDPNTGYVFDDYNGTLTRARSSVWPCGPRTVRVAYVAGYATIPGDLERAAIEIIGTKLRKGVGNLYHITTADTGEANVTGVRFDDIPDDARRILDRYASQAA